MRLHNRFPPGQLAMFATCAFGGFATLLVIELWIGHIAMQTASLVAEIDALQRYLQQTPTLASDRRALEELTARLHLTEDPGSQTSVVMKTVQGIAKLHGLELMLLRKQPDANGSRTRPAPLARTVYSLVLEGRYRSELSALDDLATAPLASHVEAVSFERIERQGSAAGIVRMSVELAVYRTNPHAVGARPS